MVVTLPSGTTPADLQQAQKLILRGKEFAAFGDPKTLRIIQFLTERGFESPESKRIRERFLEQREITASDIAVMEEKPLEVKLAPSISFEEQLRLERAPQVQAVQPPKDIFERIGRFGSNIFGRFQTQQQTGREVSFEPLLSFPFEAVEFLGEKAKVGVSKGVKKFAPEFEGIPAETLFRPEKVVQVEIPQFGTLDILAPATKEVVIPEKPVREFKIFEPERVAEGVGFGVEVAAFGVVPPAIIAPSLIFEGGKTFLDPEATPIQKVIGVGEVGLGAGIGLRGAFNLIRETNRASKIAVNLAKKTEVPNKVVQSFDVSDAILVRTRPDGSKVFNIEGKVVTKIVNAKTGRTINKLSTDTVSQVITARTKSGAIRAFVESTSQTISDTARRVSRLEPKVTISGTLEKTKGNVIFFPLEEGGGFVGLGAFETADLGKIFGRVTPKGKIKIKKDKGGILEGIQEDPFLKIEFVKTRTPQVTKTRSFLEVKPLKEEIVVKKIKDLDILGRRTIGETTSFDIIFPQTLKVKGGIKIRPSEKGILGGIVREPSKVIPIPRKKGLDIDIIRPRKEDKFIDVFIKETIEPQIVKEIGVSKGIGATFEPKEIISNLDKLTAGVIKPSRKIKPVKDIKKPKTPGDILEQKLTGLDENLIGGALGQQFTGAVARQIKARVIKPVKLKPKVKVKKAVGVKDITGVEVGIVSAVSPDITGRQELKGELTEKERQEFGLLPVVIQRPKLDITAKEDVAQSSESRTIQAGLRRLNSRVDLPQDTFIPVPPRITTKPPKKPKLIPELDDFKEDPLTKKIRLSKKPHDVFVKSKRKRVKIADNVMGDLGLDLGAVVSDKSLGAEFSVKESKGKIKAPPFNPPKDYWEFNQHKFRGFRRKKGRKIPLKNVWIERRKHRLDTRQETQAIGVQRFLKQQKNIFNQRLLVNKRFSNIFSNPIGSNNPKPRRKSVRKAPKKQKRRGGKNMFNIPFNLA